MRSLTVLPADDPLCRQDGRTCAACCFGERVPRGQLERRLRRQTALLRDWIGQGRLSRRRLWQYEFRARPAMDLLWAFILLLPVVGNLLRPWLQKRSVCAFLGFEDDEESRVGCILHPARWGVDHRQKAAFALWRGFGCGAGDYFCSSAWIFRRLPWRVRRDFLREIEPLDWFEYSRRCRFGSYHVLPQPGVGQAKESLQCGITSSECW
jgi:hypothetical protein